VLVELAIVGALSFSFPLGLPCLLRLLPRRFLNQLRRDLVDAASVSEAVDAMEAAYSSVRSLFAVVVVVAASGLDESLDLGVSVAVDDSKVSATGSSRGVGMGVTSVEAVTSTSSASRYHFLRRV
jgi:hypothetical protein